MASTQFEQLTSTIIKILPLKRKEDSNLSNEVTRICVNSGIPYGESANRVQCL